MKADEIRQLRQDALREAEEAADAQALEQVRVKYLSRKGLVPDIMKHLKTLGPDERREAGRQANELKDELQLLLEKKKDVLQQTARTTRTVLDVTVPGDWRGAGTLHPIHRIIDRCTDIFHALGFTAAAGPDIETVYHNFDALNTPDDHPSRDPQDTFYLDNGDLLRCHTSPVQVRFMESHQPPVRIIAPGRCYRRDTPDATHSANFHQVEGLYVSRGVTMADLKGDLTYFAQRLLGPGVKARFRPHFFPFTEPSVEVDFSCHVCAGKGCRVCKYSGWIEIAGAGMVDPNVFRQVGYDPEVYTGYAFGMGVERLAMILYDVHDIRDLYQNDARFLRQF